MEDLDTVVRRKLKANHEPHDALMAVAVIYSMKEVVCSPEHNHKLANVGALRSKFAADSLLEI